jgi:hypothetical protein
LWHSFGHFYLEA